MSPRGMPDGVVGLFYAAMEVSADEKRAKIARRAAPRRPPRYRSASISGAPKLSGEDRTRAALLAAVRRGDPAAITELRERHHAWIVTSPEDPHGR